MMSRGIALVAILAMLFLPTAIHAQGVFTDASSLAAGGPTEEILQVAAQFTSPGADGFGALYVTAKIAKGWHIYSITQQKGGPVPTRVAPIYSKQFSIVGATRAWPKPHVTTEEVWKNLPIETHEGQVTWYAPVQFEPDVDLKTSEIEGSVTAQACNDQGCLPPKKYKFVAKLGEGVKLPPEADPVGPLESEREKPADKPATSVGAALGELLQPGTHTMLRGEVYPALAMPGGTVRLTITAEPQSPYHVYALEAADSGKGAYKPTLIQLTQAGGWTASEPVASAAPTEKKLVSGDKEELQRYYDKPVSWTIELAVPRDAAPGQQTLAGVIGYQSCFDGGCDRPTAARFEAAVTVAKDASAGTASALPVAFSPAKYKEASQLARAPEQAPDKGVVAAAPLPAASLVAADPLAGVVFEIADDDELSRLPLPKVVFYGFLGGLLLNLMPCVLPVIGLKVLSFVEQSGQSRGRILALNIWYSLGLISVFMVLATLAAFAGMGWGEMFSRPWFNMVLATVVFAMSLSFLGLWEIPIPGFIGGHTSHQLASREGATGAFCKGAITTVLATPCTGPFLTTALFWAASQNSAALVYAVFASVGVGMASPYLLIGAFPQLVRWLPKPGAWMETFKQAMGFVLLATLVYLLTLVPFASVVPTIALLFGVWAACWWIGRKQWSTSSRVKWLAWGQGMAVASVVGVFAFTYLQREMDARLTQSFDAQFAKRLTAPMATVAESDAGHIDWRPFDLASFHELAQAGQTILVDFTAPWCLTCQVLESAVLDTEPMRDLLKKNNVATLQAQWIDEYPETGRMLEKLKSEQIPVVAIFPAGDWKRPIVLRGPQARGKYLDALAQAGPSKDMSTVAAAPTAMSVAK
jgi:thiol:disulfide interchange protein